MYGLIASAMYNKNRLQGEREIDSALSYAPRNRRHQENRIYVAARTLILAIGVLE